mgnify:CR=1 FL=1
MAQLKKPIRLKELIDSALAELGIGKELKRWQLVKDFGKIVGDHINTHAKAYKIADGELYVQVDSPSWMNQLYLIKDEIIKKLNNSVGEDLIKDIRFNLIS